MITLAYYSNDQELTRNELWSSGRGHCFRCKNLATVAIFFKFTTLIG